MRIILFGIQGSGKGTQASILAGKLKIPHISTGDLVRGATGGLKEKVNSFADKGLLVPDNLILEMLKERIKKDDCKNGFILDGYPRNIEQAKALDKITKIDKAIEIHLSDEEATKRVLGRRTCKTCKLDYNVNNLSLKPKKDELCDNCGKPLSKRADDNQEAIAKRLETYHKETEPIFIHYKTIKVKGSLPIEELSKEIIDVLGRPKVI